MSPRIIHWFDRSLALDATTSGADYWVNAEDGYLDFGDNNQASFSIEMSAIGVGASSVELYFERTSLAGGDQEQFEVMNTSGLIAVARGHQWIKKTFGRNAGDDLYPRGTGRIRLVNTSASQVYITMRVWVALSKYERKATAQASSRTGARR